MQFNNYNFLKVDWAADPLFKESPYKEPRLLKSRLASALISPPTFKDGGVKLIKPLGSHDLA